MIALQGRRGQLLRDPVHHKLVNVHLTRVEGLQHLHHQRKTGVHVQLQQSVRQAVVPPHAEVARALVPVAIAVAVTVHAASTLARVLRDTRARHRETHRQRILVRLDKRAAGRHRVHELAKPRRDAVVILQVPKGLRVHGTHLASLWKRIRRHDVAARHVLATHAESVAHVVHVHPHSALVLLANVQWIGHKPVAHQKTIRKTIQVHTQHLKTTVAAQLRKHHRSRR